MFQLSDVQLAILRVLWERGRGTVAEVHRDLPPDRDLASSTVATLLSRMEKRGLVTHETEGRKFVYRPNVSEHDVRSDVLETVTDGLFEGDVAALVSHLLDPRSVANGDLDRVQQLLDAMRREAGDEEGDR